MVIWVVDDNHSLLEILEEVLSDEYSVKTYDSADLFQSAFSTVNDARPSLLLIDWNLPGASTEVLLTQFTAEVPECRIAVMSGDLASIDRWPSGCYPLQKPFKLKDLKEWIQGIESSLAINAALPLGRP